MTSSAPASATPASVPAGTLPAARPATGPSPDALGVRSRARRSALLLAVLAVASLASIVLCVGIGPVPIPAGTTVQVIAHHLGLPAPAAQIGRAHV